MRILLMPVLLGAALFSAAPAVAQHSAPAQGAIHRGSSAQGPANMPIPAPGGIVQRARAPIANGAQFAPPPRMAPNPPPQMRGPQRPTRPEMLAPNAPGAGSRVWQNGRWNALPSRTVTRSSHPNRWGYSNGRWDGGNRAPGGWNAYRRLNRGHHIPQYWLGGAFGIHDYLSYGLASPPRGYRWVRYYDDAVLIDDGGQVWDSLDGISWTGAEGEYADSQSYSYSSSGYGPPPIPPVDPDAYYDQWAYQGGQAEYGASHGSSYQQGSYHYGAPTWSMVTIVTAPITTTTVIEEVIEEVATTSYVRAAPRRVVRKAPVKRYRAKPKCCVCVCR